MRFTRKWKPCFAALGREYRPGARSSSAQPSPGTIARSTSLRRSMRSTSARRYPGEVRRQSSHGAARSIRGRFHRRMETAGHSYHLVRQPTVRSTTIGQLAPSTAVQSTIAATALVPLSFPGTRSRRASVDAHPTTPRPLAPTPARLPQQTPVLGGPAARRAGARGRQPHHDIPCGGNPFAETGGSRRGWRNTIATQDSPRTRRPAATAAAVR